MKISIIVPSFNGKKLLEKNLPAVFKACQSFSGSKNDWEIIVVEDGSSDKSVSFIKEKYPTIKLVVHKDNQYFAVSCNDGVKAAQGEIVVLLNNDVIPEKNFLEPLLENFSDKMVFSVGCQEKSQDKSKTILSGRAGGEFKRGFLVHWRAKDQDKKDTLWTASGSAAYRKSLWVKLGGLDPLFRPAYGEDIDLSYRALKSGFKVLFEAKSKVFHQHETTNIKAFGEKKIKIYAFKNQFLFVWKNITDIKYLFLHFFWLFYHLLSQLKNGDWLFFKGFLLAVKQLSETLSSRSRAKKHFRLKDREII